MAFSYILRTTLRYISIYIYVHTSNTNLTLENSGSMWIFRERIMLIYVF